MSITFIKSITHYINRYYLLWLVMLHLPYFIYAVVSNHIFTLDSYEYLNQAHNLLNHGSMYCGDWDKPIIPELYTRRTILYGLLIMVLKFFISSNTIMLVFQNLLSIFTLYKLPFIISKFANNSLKIPALVFFAFVLFSPWFIYTNMIMVEIPMSICVFWSFYFLLRFEISDLSVHYFGFIAFAVLAVLLKPVMLYFSVPIGGIALFYFIKRRNYKVLIFPLIFPLAIFLHSLLSLKLTGDFHYCSIKNHNSLHYNAEVVLYKLFGYETARKITDSIENNAPSQKNFSTYNKYIVKQADSIILNNWFTYGMLEARGILNFFIDPGRYDIEQFIPPNHPIQISFFGEIHKYGAKGFFIYLQKIDKGKVLLLSLVFLANVFVLIMYLVFLIKKNIPLYIKVYATIFIGYFALLIGPLGNSRFKTEIFLILIFSAVLGFLQYFKDKKDIID